MKKSSVRKMAGAVTAFALMASAATALAQTKTAQSAMFENTATGTFVIVGTEVWAYNKDTAATYFSNALVSGPTVTCSGNSTNCNVLNQPATPAVPAPDAQKLNGFIGSNSCNFWDGQALALNPLGPDNQYPQSVTINGLNGNGNWKFQWTYEVGFADTVGGPYPAATAWDLQDSSSASASVAVTGFFAGQSTQLKSNTSGGWSFKASHTMLDSLGESRLVNARAVITDAEASTVCNLPLVTNILSNQDFTYLGNAGRNGTLNNLFDNGSVANGTVNAIQGGISTALNSRKDDHAGNNGTGGDQAVIDSLASGSCSISAVGDYTLNVTGTLKGVSGGSSLPVAVNSKVCVSAGTCKVCTP